MFWNLLKVPILLLMSIIILASGEQTFQRNDENHQVNSAIHPGYPQGHAMQPYPRRRLNRNSRVHRYPRRFWRQNDRITKDEVGHNVAKALLDRKMTGEESQNEKRSSNKKKLQRYARFEARMARQEAAQLSHPPAPPQQVHRMMRNSPAAAATGLPKTAQENQGILTTGKRETVEDSGKHEKQDPIRVF